MNKIFHDQIEFFNKVKLSLPVESKRVQDIDIYVEKLELAIQETDVSKKDDIYFGTFQSVINTIHMYRKKKLNILKKIYFFFLEDW